MSNTDLEPLSTEIESLLAEERNFLPESADVRARAMTRARAALGETRAARSTSFWRRRIPLLVAALLVTAFAAVAIAAWKDLRGSSGRHPSVAPSARGARDARARALEPKGPVAEAASPEPGSESAPKLPDLPGDTVGTPRPSSASDASDSYALELGVLERARAAVASREFSIALDAVAEHQRRFPAGRLREEREALRIKALVGLGRKDEARRAAERFRARFPKSVLSTRIEETARPDR